MKTRLGFVSNSSSSSFLIVDAKDIEICKYFGIKLYRIIDIMNALQPAVNSIRLMRLAIGKINQDNIPIFIEQEFDESTYEPAYEQTYENLKRINDRYPGSYITEPVDRDEAYERGISLRIYQSDL